VILALVFLGARGTLEHRPINPAKVAYSSDAMVNALALNSLYSVFDAAYRMRDERSSAAMYPRMAVDEMNAIVREKAGLTGAPLDARYPSLHEQKATVRRDKPLNLVIILQESLGAQYVGSLGGRDLTPNIDRLGKEGWMFHRAYATGTRSVRGIEAVTAGFLPSVADAVVKLPRSQTGFFTLAQVLGKHGYHSRFVYGGESHFDNMRAFFLGNGFDEIVDRPKFVNPVFEGSWGASDEDMFNQVDRLLRADGDKPVFTLAFSVTNHSPWEYPEGRIKPVGDPATVDNTVRYADWALGQFFDKARRAPYWDNTVFLVIADHDSRVYGSIPVPVRHFQIPALILGAGIAPRQDERLVSQIDMAPTMLSLMGLDNVNPMLGVDLTQRDPDRAMMQYADNFGYLRGDQLLVLEPSKAPRQFRYEAAPVGRDEVYAPVEPLDPRLSEEALAHALWASWAYREERYRLP
jgi:phosphoglycerol transferase MdoB-like AlkP superfamily enzyme